MNIRAAFSGLSVDDLQKAKEFYTKTLGLTLIDETMGLRLELPGRDELFVYAKPDYISPTSTTLNFVVDNIDAAIDELTEKGVTLEHYDNLPALQDEKGVLRGLRANQGPDIAWFKDPAGNILSVLQDK